MQLELFERDQIDVAELARIAQEFRAGYWQLRSMRGGRWTQAKERQIYRRLAPLKKRLMLAGVDKRSILDFLSCCRLKCRCPGGALSVFLTNLVGKSNKMKLDLVTVRKLYA